MDIKSQMGSYCRLGLLVLATAGWLGATPEPAAPDVRHDAVVTAVAKVMPSVVNVATETVVQVQDPFERMWRDFYDPYHRSTYSSYSLGSGVIISDEGYVLTNDHVVRRADKIQVQLASGTNVYEAQLVASDSANDLALLKIAGRPGEKFTAIKFAQDDDLLLGETVLALGNPFGLGGSVSRGILSAKSRMIPVDNKTAGDREYLQTDASINPGNSGGPLVDLDGNLIGLNTAILSQAQGIGFAIPVKQVGEILSGIFTPESARQIWFGAKVKPGTRPLLISEVQLGSPADRAGLEPGDTVLALNGSKPQNFIDFNEALIAAQLRPVSLNVLHDGQEKTLEIKPVAESTFFNTEMIQRRLGVSLQELTPQLADALNLNSTDGFIVAGVERDGPAANSLQRGYLVTGIDGQAPTNLTAVAKILYAKRKGEIAQLQVTALRREQGYLVQQTGVVKVPVR